MASERPRARGRARENHASAAKRAVISAGSHRTGSRSAARLSATPPIAATGIHKKKRRSSTSRASALENAPRQSGAHAAARVQPAAAERAPVRAGVAIWGETNARLTLGKGADRRSRGGPSYSREALDRRIRDLRMGYAARREQFFRTLRTCVSSADRGCRFRHADACSIWVIPSIETRLSPGAHVTRCSLRRRMRA